MSKDSIEPARIATISKPAVLAVSPSTPLASYKEIILGDGPVGYWRLGADPTRDETGRGHTGTIVGSGLTSRSGLIVDSDLSTTFPVTARIDIPDHADFAFGVGSFSYEYWGLTSYAGSPAWLLPLWKGGSDATTRGFDMETNSSASKLAAAFIGDGTRTQGVYSNSAINDGQVHQIVAVADRSAQRLRLYVDGIQHNANDITAVGSATSTQAIQINQVSNPWHGDLDEVAIYPYALSAAQVLAHYNAGKAARVLTPTTSSEPRVTVSSTVKGQ